MDILKEAALLYKELLHVEYNLIISRKHVPIKIKLRFKDIDFHHIVGLKKLSDVKVVFRTKRDRVFNEIMCDKINYMHICNSNYFLDMEERLKSFKHLEFLLDSNEIIFRYCPDRIPYSKIEARFILKNEYNGNEIYIFIDMSDEEDIYFCRSFFPKTKVDFTVKQPLYTLLYKEKINTITKEKQIQYVKVNLNLEELKDRVNFSAF